jgi:hypothetical protein
MSPTLTKRGFTPIKHETALNAGLEDKMLKSSIPEIKVHDFSPVNSSDGEDVSDLSQDINDILASFSSNKTTGEVESTEKRKAPRFRVKWFADILTDEHVVYHGFVNDISTLGASIFLNSNLNTAKCTLRIHVPPLNLMSKPYVMEVSGKILYVVYDSDKQLFRAAVSFIRFNPESDLSFLDERLTKHHSKAPEL